jgi:hypothetical protein
MNLPTLIDNARSAWRLYSVQAFVALITLETMWLAVPAEIKAGLSPSFVHWVSLVVAVGGLIGRFMKQRIPTA